MEITIKVMNILIALHCSQENSAMYYRSSLLPWGPIPLPIHLLSTLPLSLLDSIPIKSVHSTQVAFDI